jgi:HEAT repeat protein
VFGDRRAKRAVKAGDTQTLVDLLADADPKVRANTANACMEILPGSTTPALVAALLRTASDPESKVRGQAVLALGSVRAEEARDLFLRSLADEDWLVRMFAATAIGWMPDPRAVEGVGRLLEHDEPFVRGAAAFTLGAIGTPECATLLHARRERERDPDVREAIDEGLVKTSGSG